MKIIGMVTKINFYISYSYR